jgi:hypothetical protein
MFRNITLALVLSVLIVNANVAKAACETDTQIPAGIGVVGTATATFDHGASISVGPGGPVFARVKNTGNGPAIFQIFFRKKGGSLINSICATGDGLSAGEVFVVEMIGGDDLPERVADVVTNVQGATLEVTIFKEPNLLPTTVSDRVTIRMRAFIPSSLPNSPQATEPVPNKPGSFMIRGPVAQATALLNIDLSSDCFLTDNRTFSPDPGAASKVTTEFRIIINHGQVAISPATGTQAHKAGNSTRLQCATGNVVAVKPGDFSGLFGVRALGKPAVADNKIQIIGQAAIANPHLSTAPMIDYSFDFTYDSSTHRLKFTVTAGRFPALEVYAFRGNGSPVTVLQLQPASESAWGLIDGGLGLGMANHTGEVQL